MLIKTETALALRCPDCGRAALKTISRFALGRGRVSEYRCSCGSRLLTAGTKGRKSYWLAINCVICDANHTYHLTPGELWTQNSLYLSCLETGLELGCIGPHERVQAYLQTKEETLEMLVEEMGGPSYFRDAEVMLSILTHVHTLAEDGGLSCPCGENCIELEIFPDRVELHCRHCLRMCVLPAEAEQDLAELETRETIELARQVFAGKRKKTHRRKRDNHQP
jgi:predicted RNA-binding Zn-ribbon protein involved in translation (DUF1610 family)